MVESRFSYRSREKKKVIFKNALVAASVVDFHNVYFEKEKVSTRQAIWMEYKMDEGK